MILQHFLIHEDLIYDKVYTMSIRYAHK